MAVGVDGVGCAGGVHEVILVILPTQQLVLEQEKLVTDTESGNISLASAISLLGR